MARILFLICILHLLPLLGIGQDAKDKKAEDIRTVTGTVSDSRSEATLSGVQIHELGTNNSTTTDSDGKYSISVSDSAVISITQTGYEKRMFAVKLCEENNESRKSKDKCDETVIADVPLQKHYDIEIIGDDNKCTSPYFFIKSDDPEIDRMPLKSTRSDVQITGPIARVTITQQYINEGNSVIEAVYIFPGSTKAAVYGLNMKIGDRLLEAQIKEKEAARQKYEVAKSEGKTATLLEQQRPNVFQMNIANILPGDTIEVQLYYTEMIESQNGLYEFVYPTVVGPRYANSSTNTKDSWAGQPYLHKGEKPDNSFSLHATINSGIPIKKVLSSSHRININYRSPVIADVTIDETEGFSGNKDFVLQYQLRGKEVEAGLLLYEHEDENFFAYIMEPPLAPTLKQIPKREYIFIIDVSGSMRGFPLDISKEMFRELSSKLSADDKFNILFFAGDSQVLFDKSQKATKENIEKATAFFESIYGYGGTELLPALQNAMAIKTEKRYSRTFIAITDGYVTVEKEAFNLIRNNLNEANFFAFGIGSSVNRYLIEGMAYAGNGKPFIALNRDEASTIAQQFAEMISKPVLTDIQLKFDNLDVYDIEPQSIPDVFTGSPIIVYGKYRGKPTGTVSLQGISGENTVSISTPVKFVKDADNSAIRYLWARNRLKYLSDYACFFEQDHRISFNGKYDRTNQKDRIIETGLRYNLLSEFTSFIVVDSIVRNKTAKSETVHQPLPLPEGVANSAVGNNRIEFLSDDEVIEKWPVPHQNYGSYGNPGAGVQVQIRGMTSVSNSQPLYVIDGVPTTEVKNINPNDIVSVNILKDASATAQYGAKGAAGVVIITTNKADKSEEKVSFFKRIGLFFKRLFGKS